MARRTSGMRAFYGNMAAHEPVDFFDNRPPAKARTRRQRFELFKQLGNADMLAPQYRNGIHGGTFPAAFVD